jgi:maleate isomerase
MGTARFPKRIGMIVPFDMALDREYWELVPDDVSLHITRLPIVDLPYGPAHARRVADAGDLAAAAGTLARIGPSVVAFGCTSASFVDGLAGEAAVRAAIESAGIPEAVTPSGALVEELDRLGVRRVGLGTPYDEPLGRALADLLTEAGFEPASLVNLAYTDEEDVVAASDAVVIDLADRARTPDAEAVFLACTNLPTVRLLPRLRERLGIPVLTANQVLIDAALRRTGALEVP